MGNRKIFIGAAWPYANGSLHLGHAAALLGSDVLARYFRLNGDSVLFVSGSDCHGTPIALQAEKLGIKPEEIANKYHQEFSKTLIQGLNFSFDYYSETTKESHQKLVQDIFLDLWKKKLIYTKTEELAYCDTCQRFLPDRYIEGECPHCHFGSARGDQCDNCGNLIDPKTLIKPQCQICHQAPVWKESEHFFLKISAFNDDLKQWVENSQGWRLNAKSFSLELLKQGFRDRAISRDTDWGIPIPLPGYESKRIYVWFEAVCGYLSASQDWNSETWKDFWQNDSACHYYVHGKDNIPFHTIIWPSILLGLGDLNLPNRIISSEYMTLEKKQFSTSRNWMVSLPDFLSEFEADLLRYYLIVNGPETSDADFSWSEFALRINKELVGTFGNFVFRVLSFISKNFNTNLDFPEDLKEDEVEILKLASETFSKVGQSLEAGRFRQALRDVFFLAEEGNRYLNNKAPWKVIKEDREQAQRDLTLMAYIIKCLAVLINPFLPQSSELLADQVGLDFNQFKWGAPLDKGLELGIIRPLFKTISEEEIKVQEKKLNRC
jgi:methionyl-tRNA synthetase